MVQSLLHFYSVGWNTLPLLHTQASGQPQKQKSWCYATVRSIRLSLDEDKLVKANGHHHCHSKSKAKNNKREKIIVEG
jgi:hypothetical protein